MPNLESPLSDLRFSVVGPGRVGSSLAAWACSAGAELRTVAGRPESRGARGAAERLGARFVPIPELETAGDDLLLVTVADPALEDVARELSRRPQARVALHASGSRPAAAISALGPGVGSLHPLAAFPEPRPDPSAAEGIVFAIDGDPEARALAGRLARTWGGRAVEVEAAERPLYHLAATLAAGGVVTLLATAATLVRRLGLGEEILEGHLALARSALDGVERSSAAAAITGPVARADLATVEEQIAAVRELDPEIARTCLEIARAACRELTRAGGGGTNLERLAERLAELAEP